MSKEIEGRISLSYMTSSHEARSARIVVEDHQSGRALIVVTLPLSELGRVMASEGHVPCQARIYDNYTRAGLTRKSKVVRVPCVRPPSSSKNETEVQDWQQDVFAQALALCDMDWSPITPDPRHLSQRQYDPETGTIAVTIERFVPLSSTPEGVQP